MSQGFESQHRGFHRRPSASFQAYENNCIVKFSTWPSSGTAITNEGSAGSGYDGVAADNDYYLLASGATSFKFNGTTDKVTVSKGAAIDNIANVTVEFVVYINGWGAAGAGVLFNKATVAGAFGADLNGGDGRLRLYRLSANGPNFDMWTTTNVVAALGNWYDIQITWVSGVGPGATPHIYVTGVDGVQHDCALTHTLTGAGNWVSDSNYDLCIGDWPTYNHQWNGNFVVFRIHNAVLTDAQLTQNYNADKWRVGL